MYPDGGSSGEVLSWQGNGTAAWSAAGTGQDAAIHDFGSVGAASVTMPAGYSVYNASLTSGSVTTFLLPSASVTQGQVYMLRTTNNWTGASTFSTPVITTQGSDVLTWIGAQPTWQTGGGSVNFIMFEVVDSISAGGPVNVIQARADNSGLVTPVELDISATNQGGSDFNTTPWLELVNTGDNTESGLRIDYYQYDGATRMVFAPNNFGNSKGAVLEYAPSEDILIIGMPYNSSGNYPVSTYFDGANVMHFGKSVATDLNAPVSVSGTTAGGFSWVMPFIGNYYKKLLMYFSGYENDTSSNQVYNLTTGGYGNGYLASFSTVAEVTHNSAGINITFSGSTVTIYTTNSTTTYSGLVIVEGW